MSKRYEKIAFVASASTEAQAALTQLSDIYGNHDAESEMTRRLALPPNVRAFDTRKPSTFRFEQLRVALHGRSFAGRAVPEDLAAAYPDPVQG